MNLSQKLKQKYPYLKNISLVDSEYDYSDLKSKLGLAASKLFEIIFNQHNDPRVGIGGGSTLFEFVNNIEIKSRKIRLFPTALIGRGPEITHVDSTFLTKMFYFKSRQEARAFVISIPPLPDKKESALNFLKLLNNEFQEVKWLINAMQKVDIALVGLGALMPTGDFDEEMMKVGVSLKELKDLGVIGGINYNWFDSNGQQVTNFFPTICINKLIELSKNKTKDIILVAGGAHKVEPIKIALNVQMVNGIVSDKQTIYRLFKDKNDFS